VNSKRSTVQPACRTWNAPSNSKLQFTYWEEGSKESTQVVTSNPTVSGTGTFSQDVGVDSSNTNYVFKSCVYNDDTGESNDGPELTFESGTGESTTPTGSEGGCGSIDPVEDGTSGSDGTDDTTSDDAPQITNYEVTSSGNEITVSFDSDETLVNIEVDVRGPDSGTLTEEDFDGDRFSGYEATYQASEDGDYTLELVTAEDASNDDGANDGDYSDSTSVQTSDDGTGDDTPTATDDSSGDDGTGDDTPTATDDGTGDDGSGGESDDSSGDDGTGDDGSGGESDDGGDEADDTDTSSDGDGAGFGSVVAVTALLASTLLFYRRR